MLLIPYECKGHILSPDKQLRPLFYINFYCDPEPCCNNFWRMLAVGEGLSVANFFVSYSCYRQLFPMKRLQSTTPGLLLCCARRQLSWESPNQKERSWRKPWRMWYCAPDTDLKGIKAGMRGVVEELLSGQYSSTFAQEKAKPPTFRRMCPKRI